MQRHIIRTILVFLIEVLGFSTTYADSGRKYFDTIYTLDYVKGLVSKKDAPVLYILDSIDRREAAKNYHDIPYHKIVIARALFESRNLRPNVAINLLKSILYTKELQNDHVSYLETIRLLSNEYYVTNQIEQSVRYVIMAAEKSLAMGNYNSYVIDRLNMLLVISDINENPNLAEQAQQLRAIARQHRDQCDSILIIWSLEVEAQLLANQKDIAKRQSLYKQILNIYQNMTSQDRKGTEVESEEQLKFKLGQTHATLAHLYAIGNDLSTAAYHYAMSKTLLSNLPTTISGELYSTIISYLMQIKNYDEALQYSRKFEDIAASTDTINMFSLMIKRHMSSIYQAMDQYKQAWLYERQAAVIADSLYKRACYNSANEMATIYKMAEKQETILRQETSINHLNRYMSVLWGVVIAMIVIAITMYLYSVKIRDKNKVLFRQIEKLSKAQSELEKIRTSIANQAQNEHKTDDEPDNLFNALSLYMTLEKPFLDPAITREQVAAYLGTNKTYLATAIQNAASQTFSDYINTMRLEYAKKLLVDNLDIKVEAIASMSGFNSVRTFYRLFHQTYSLTPSEFRKLSSMTLHD